jgi:hypothetical protein
MLPMHEPELPAPYREMEIAFQADHIGRPAAGGIGALRKRLEMERDGAIRLIPPPWRGLRAALGGGFLPGNVTIIIGSAGVAKSYALLNVLLHAGQFGFSWRLIPLEDDAGRGIQRMLAVKLCDWGLVAQPLTDSEAERRRVADAKLAVLETNREFVAELYERIYENPWLPIDDGSGRKISRPVDYEAVLDCLRDEAASNDIVGLDCLSQIIFSEDGRDYRGQAEFMRGAVGIAADSGCHLILVGHNAKAGAQARDPLDAIQGSALFGRLAHNIVSLTRHDPIVQSELFSRDTPYVAHRLTLSVLKCRGGESGTRFAYDLEASGPCFREHGPIKPRAAK